MAKEISTIAWYYSSRPFIKTVVHLVLVLRISMGSDLVNFFVANGISYALNWFDNMMMVSERGYVSLGHSSSSMKEN